MNTERLKWYVEHYHDDYTDEDLTRICGVLTRQRLFAEATVYSSDEGFRVGKRHVIKKLHSMLNERTA